MPSTEPDSSRAAVVLPGRSPRRAVLRAVVVAVAIVVVGLVLVRAPADQHLAVALNALHTGTVARLTDAVYLVFEPVPAVLLTVALTGVVWAVTRRLVVAAAFAGTVALTWIPSAVVKVVVDRPRPPAGALPHPFSPAQVDPSYPSGHVVFVTALVLAVYALVRGTRWARPVVVLGTVLVVAVAVALCIDAVHWPTDVVASVVWSCAVAPAARAVWVDVVLRRAVPRMEQTGRHRDRTGEDAS